MFCVDWNEGENLQIYGNEKNDEYQRVELVLTPCNYLHTHLGYEGDTIHPECVADLDAQIEYLGAIEFLIYYTQETFMQTNFDDQSFE